MKATRVRSNSHTHPKMTVPWIKTNVLNNRHSTWNLSHLRPPVSGQTPPSLWSKLRMKFDSETDCKGREGNATWYACSECSVSMINPRINLAVSTWGRDIHVGLGTLDLRVWGGRKPPLAEMTIPSVATYLEAYFLRWVPIYSLPSLLRPRSP